MQEIKYIKLCTPTNDKKRFNHYQGVTLVGLVKIVQNASHFLDVTGEMGIVANLWNANVTMDTLGISANMQIVQQDATHNMAIALTPILVGVIQVGKKLPIFLD